MTAPLTNRTDRRIRASIAALALLLSPAGEALAQSAPGAGPPVDRRRLLQQAQTARERGDHNLALYFAEQAGRLQMTSSVRRFIAEEQQALGRLPDAASSARRCVREAESEPPSQNHGIVLAGCQQLQSSLEAQLGRLRVLVQGASSARAQVEVADRPVDAQSLADPVYVTAGRVTVRVIAAGVAPIERTVEVSAGQQLVVSVDVPAASEPGSQANTTNAANTANTTINTAANNANTTANNTANTTVLAPLVARVAPPPPRTVTTRGWSALGPIVGGVGVASMAVSGALWAVSGSAYASLRARCEASGCPGDAMAASEANSIRTLDAATTATLVAGAALTVTGAVLLFAVRPTHTVTVEGPTVTALSIGAGTLRVHGAF